MNAVLTGAVGFSSKRSLIEKFAVTGPVPGSGAKAPESGAGRSQHRILGGAAAENVKLRGRGLYADNLSMIIIYVKTEAFKSRSVAPDPLERFVMAFICILVL